MGVKAFIQILVGLILIVVLIWFTFFSIWPSFSQLLWKSVYMTLIGGLAWLVLLISIALIIVGFSELNEK